MESQPILLGRKSSSCTICNKQIASYTMQSTRLPISVANEIDSINRKFLWGSSDDKRIIPLVKWDVNFSTINRRKRSGLACQFRLFEERRDLAAARMAARQQQVARHYNSRVRARRFQVGDLVMCSCEASRPARDQNKLSPNWEGPYRITKLLKEVSKRIPGPWLVTGDFNTVRKKQRKTGKPLTLESKDTTRPSSSTQFEEQNRGDGEEELEIENSSTSIVDLVAVEKTVNEVSAADCALTFVPPTVNEGVKIARLKPECEGGGKVEIGFNWLCVRIDTETNSLGFFPSAFGKHEGLASKHARPVNEAIVAPFTLKRVRWTHLSGQGLHRRIKHMGYVWPSMAADALAYAKSCQELMQRQRPSRTQFLSRLESAKRIDILKRMIEATAGVLSFNCRLISQHAQEPRDVQVLKQKDWLERDSAGGSARKKCVRSNKNNAQRALRSVSLSSAILSLRGTPTPPMEKEGVREENEGHSISLGASVIELNVSFDTFFANGILLQRVNTDRQVDGCWSPWKEYERNEIDLADWSSLRTSFGGNKKNADRLKSTVCIMFLGKALNTDTAEEAERIRMRLLIE
ncbi:hypothetical protein ZIOFF_074448 (mitochondrion) [Zingiber officinale]|uniref:Uncharacterized protein n=1 Tax=Zingiber officinale TaxID=94328 RepID=A0A8J5C5Q4_ZINOF|nr:hypothetical protein ZIOFF_074448 [Zingiber officinale]